MFPDETLTSLGDVIILRRTRGGLLQRNRDNGSICFSPLFVGGFRDEVRCKGLSCGASLYRGTDHLGLPLERVPQFKYFLTCCPTPTWTICGGFQFTGRGLAGGVLISQKLLEDSSKLALVYSDSGWILLPGSANHCTHFLSLPRLPARPEIATIIYSSSQSGRQFDDRLWRDFTNALSYVSVEVFKGDPWVIVMSWRRQRYRGRGRHGSQLSAGTCRIRSWLYRPALSDGTSAEPAPLHPTEYPLFSPNEEAVGLLWQTRRVVHSKEARWQEVASLNCPLFCFLLSAHSARWEQDLDGSRLLWLNSCSQLVALLLELGRIHPVWVKWCFLITTSSTKAL